MSKKKIIQSLLFLLIGLGLFGYAYKDLNLSDIGVALHDLKYGWIVLSFLLGLFSHWIRAIRWQMLIEPMGHKASALNLFLSVLVMYFTNLIIPRGGEIARCGVITRYERVPFPKLVGTVFTERVTDMLAFCILFLVIFLWQFPSINQLFASSEVTMDFDGMKTKLLWGGIGLVLLILLFFLFRWLGVFKSLHEAILQVKQDFTTGVLSILNLKRKGLFIFYTFLIFFLWLLMLYVVFFAYAPTEKLSFRIAVFTYVMGSFAYLLPIQAGIGVWHLIVIQCLYLFGIDKESGMIFALVAHTFTNLIYLLFGTVSIVLLPILNNSGKENDMILEPVVNEDNQV